MYKTIEIVGFIVIVAIIACFVVKIMRQAKNGH